MMLLLLKKLCAASSTAVVVGTLAIQSSASVSQILVINECCYILLCFDYAVCMLSTCTCYRFLSPKLTVVTTVECMYDAAGYFSLVTRSFGSHKVHRLDVY